MASWCAKCRTKLNGSYLHWRGKKVHKNCFDALKKQAKKAAEQKAKDGE